MRFVAFLTALGMTTGAVLFLARSHTQPWQSYVSSDVGASFSSLFTTRYPANDQFRRELEQLKSKGKLSDENDALIRRMVDTASRHLDMPPAILWCLLFQESRLNHLQGIQEAKGATGLGQFAFFSFYEVNLHLDRFDPGNVEMMKRTLGQDVRPVGAFRRDIYNVSSYYSIPTAVASTAAYLNNRYHQLRRSLDRKSIAYDSGLLWLYAAMAYNKGSRSVMAFWNDARSEGGHAKVKRLVSDSGAFFRTFSDKTKYQAALEKIWSPEEAGLYADELTIHMRKLRDCATSAGGLPFDKTEMKGRLSP